MEKSFLGYSKKNDIPLILKILLFLMFSIVPFLKMSIFIKLGLIVFLITFRFILLGINKKSLKIYIFLILSSIMVSLFWFIFENDNLFLFENIINALIRLWILFLSGNVLLITITQDEIIFNFKKINCSSNAILFIIVSMNSLCYFIDSFKEIIKSYNARNDNSNLLKKYTYTLRTVSVDCLFLIVECKKIYTIYYDNIISALDGDYNNVKS